MCTKAFADCCRAGSSCFFAACQVPCPTPGFRFLSGACVSQPLVADAALLLRMTPSQLVAACRCACTCVCCRLLRALFLAAVEKSSLRSTSIVCATAGALASGLTTLLGAFIAFRLAFWPACFVFAARSLLTGPANTPQCRQSALRATSGISGAFRHRLLSCLLGVLVRTTCVAAQCLAVQQL